MKSITSTIVTAALAGLVFAANAAEEEKKDGERKRGGRSAPEPEALFKRLDADGDGSVSKAEFLASPRAQQNKEAAEKRFATVDKDGDGKLSQDEFTAGMKRRGGKGGGARDGDGGRKKQGE
jgi:hypothetical protein